ncbi:MAG: hypothetical protein KIS92_11210 [Planctomycetota bacterium]|nr:hypothetical protein [Planctomycetota bacterium]
MERISYPLRFGLGELMAAVVLFSGQTMLGAHAGRMYVSRHAWADAEYAVAFFAALTSAGAIYLAFRFATSYRMTSAARRLFLLLTLDAVLAAPFLLLFFAR